MSPGAGELESSDSQGETRSTPPGRPAEPGTARLRGLVAEAARALAGRYELLDELGRGAAGVVHRAREVATGREVALKLLLGEAPEARRLERFRREGELTAGLDHPGIVKVHAAGEAAGRPWIAYELVPGRTLHQVLPGLSRRERVERVRDVARALGHAHARGVVHRDVKPENVLVDAAGRVRVADFGLAAARGLAPITRTGAIIGTPAFMAPEQFAARREDVGPPTDVWAVGVMLYAALVDELPFAGGTLLELGATIERASPVWPRELDPSVPLDLEAVVRRALVGDPRGRYPDGEALARDLDAWLAGQAVTATGPDLRAVARRLARRGWPAGVLALCGLGLAAALLRPGGQAPPPAAPPRLQVDPPPDPVLEERLTLSGRVEGSGPWFQVRAGRESAQALPGRAWQLSLPLEPGPNRVVVRVEDAQGRAGEPVAIEVRRVAVPAWFRALPAAGRPPLPLPKGLELGAAAGEYLAQPDGSRLVWVAPGSFLMGSVDTPSDAPESEDPAHQVTISRGFFLGLHEVTWARWRTFATETGRPTRPQPFPAAQDHPVVDVSWVEAVTYCEWAGLRLPSEAEWEWAARGPEARLFPWGWEPPPGRANLAEGDPWPETAPVGSSPRGAAPCGCLDLVGNASEWVADYFGEYSPGPARDPTGPTRGARSAQEPELGPWRVFRGGDWKTRTYVPRAASRGRAGEHYRAPFLGFRVAR